MPQFYYLVHIQYLGFRFHGWQKQPGLKTVHFMVDKTLEFVLGEKPFKSIGSSRTDSKVSANHSAFELFVNEPLDLVNFLIDFNSNLPADIRALKIEPVSSDFNIITDPKLKEYLYLFTFGEKPHPFAASLMTYFEGELDLEKMKIAAKLLEGEHNFMRYCTKPTPNTNFIRTIDYCQIEENKTYLANFFPEKSYILRLKSKGFMRYQVRLMMAELVSIGRDELNLNELKSNLIGIDIKQMNSIAPGSGLILNNIDFVK